MKNKKLSAVFVALLVLSCLNGFAVYAFASSNKPEFCRVIIGFKGKPSETLLEGLGGVIKYSYNAIPAIACWLPPQAIDALSNNPQIAYIEEDVVVSITGKPNKPDRPSRRKGYLVTRAFLDDVESNIPYEVNGEQRGITPDTLLLKAGFYIVTATYNGETEEQIAEVVATQTTIVELNFVTIPPPPQQGTLQIKTTPVIGEVYIDGGPQGSAPVTKVVDIGSYTISFGEVPDYITPLSQTVDVYEGQTTFVEGVYEAVPPPPPPSDIPWGIDRIDADLAWDTSTGINVQVAILDTGIDKDHPELQDNILAGISFVWYWLGRPLWKPNAWDDDMGHGTWCAGIVEDIAPDVDLVAVKVMDAMGYGYTSDVIAGIDWCMDNVIDVISMSFVDPAYSNAFHNICNEAYVQGIVLVGASGNSGDGNPATNDVMYPAKYDAVIAVAGIDQNDVVTSFSSDGAEVEITAPAVNINSTWIGGGYAVHDGTSGSCPHVSGTVALLKSLDITLPQFAGYDLNSNDEWDSWEVRNRLLDTADDLGEAGRDVFYGYGLVDAQEAVTGVQTIP
jgi:subtilisin family serine protease